MRRRNWRVTIASAVSVAAACCLVPSGCSTPEQNYALGAGVLAVVGAVSPAYEIEQIYYLGVFDPQEQVPSGVYRVRVHGQSSAYNVTKFASGWVRAELIDSLGAHIEFETEGGKVSFTKAEDASTVSLGTGRRLVLFGPEGFREAPRNHRLVIVMGSSPDEFFQAMDASLGVISEVMAERRNAELDRLLFEALVTARGERERLEALAGDVEAEMPRRKAVDR